MRPTRFLMLAAAASFALPACKDSDNESPAADTSSTGEGEESSSSTTEAAEESSSSSSEGGESSSSTGEPMVTCPEEDPGWEFYAQGWPAPHWQLIDHNGEPFNLCDHYGKPVVVDTSAVWCPPCQALAQFMAGNDAASAGIINDPAWAQMYLHGMRDHVNAGSVIWVTILLENQAGGIPTDADAASWDSLYPNENIPVISDQTGDFANFLQIQAYPTTFLLNSDHTWLSRDLIEGFELVVDNLPLPGEEETGE